MADTKITALAAITTVDPAADVLPIVDISDTSMAASGTTKKITSNQILGAGGTATLASATISGDLNVSGNGAFTGTGYVALQRALNPVGENGVTSLDFRWYSTGTTYTTGARVHSSSDAAWTASSTPARLMFSTVPSGSTSLSERYRIDNAGIHTWSNVGGVAGTAMTLNSSGLGVGSSPGLTGGSRRALTVNAPTGQLSILELGINGSIAGYLFSNATQTTLAAVGATFFSVETNAAERLRVDASGSLLVGTTAAPNVGAATTSSGFSINGSGNNAYIASKIDNGTCGYFRRDGTDGAALNFYKANSAVGNISVTASACTFNSTSDYRLKESVQPLTGGLARVSALKPSIYKWKADGSNGEGFIAHELAEVVPAAVSGEKDAVNEDGSIKPQGVDMSRVVPILVAAIQELAAEVNALKNA